MFYFLLSVILAIFLACVNPKFWPLAMTCMFVAFFVYKDSIIEAFSGKAEKFVQPDDEQAVNSDEETAEEAVEIETTDEKFDNTTTFDKLFSSNPFELDRSADDLFMEKGREIGVRNKEAMDNRVRYNSANFEQYFQEELAEQEDRDWWDSNPKLDEEFERNYNN